MRIHEYGSKGQKDLHQNYIDPEHCFIHSLKSEYLQIAFLQI